MAELGAYKGKHYTEWVDEVKRRKRDGDVAGALQVLEGCMAAATREAEAQGLEPAPSYFEQAAAIHRERKDYATEVAVLERYRAACPEGGGTRLAPRLRKARELAAKQAVMAAPAACPSCRVRLEEVPTRSRKCPHCAERIVVRRSDGIVELLTADQDEERKSAAAGAKRDEKILRRANKIGIWDSVFIERRQQLSRQFGQQASMSDTFWSLANEAALASAQADENAREASVRREMAGLLADEGRDWFEQAKLAVEAQLRSIRWMHPQQRMGVVGCNCEPCSAHRPDMTYAEALSASPIPHRDCDKPPCRCWLQEDRDYAPGQPVAEIEMVVSAPSTAAGEKNRRWWQFR